MVNRVFTKVPEKSSNNKLEASQSGFALPTILLASTVLMIVAVVAAVALVSMNAAVKGTYYSQVATAAAESGLVEAESCLRTNSYKPTWTNTSPLGPNTDCTGAVLPACTGPSPAATCYVLSDTNARSTFAVTFTNFNSGVIDLHSTSTVSLLRSSNGGAVTTSYSGLEDEHLQGNGTFTEFTDPVSGAQPLGMTVGPDGAIWFAEVETTNPNIARMTLAGSFTQYSLPTTNNPRPARFTLGSDGKFYITEYTASLLASMNPSNGSATEYNVMATCKGGLLGLQTVSCNPEGIVTGPDNGIWFVEGYSNLVGRVSNGGSSYTSYTIPTANSSPRELTVGPDNAMWFSEFAGNKIGRITTAGTFTAEYTVPTANAGPSYITVGPDGAMWFTENTAGKIGRITTTGVITEYTVPTSNSQPEDIITGPDGALWFTEYNGNKIGRITTTGVITEYAVPTSGSQPFGIVTGPDGAIWFTEQSGNKIGRYALPLSENRSIY